MKTLTCGVLLLAAALGGPAGAGEVDVVNVVVRQSTAGVYRFDVTLRHADGGWDHDAHHWEIRDGDGSVRATRVPAHPHFNEQPFTCARAGHACPHSSQASPLPATTASMATA